MGKGSTVVNLNILSDFEKVKDRLFIRVNNTVRTKPDIPHRDICDLTLTVGVVVNETLDGELPETDFVTAAVNQQILNEWGVDFDSLFNLAMQNSRNLFPEEIATMYDTLKLAGVEQSSAERAFSRLIPIYIVTTANSTEFVGGASAIFYPKVADMLCHEVGGDILILPSSIHEVLVMPLEACLIMSGFDKSKFNTIISKVNQEVLDPEDWLSDNPYLYSREDKKFDLFI